MFLTDYFTRLNFSASTTDRHCKCTDDVVTEICNICLVMLVLFFSHNLSSVVIFWNGIPYQSAFSVKFVCVFLFLSDFLCEVAPDIPFMCLCYHLIDVNWRPRQCSQSESWPLSGNVTIPIHVHQSD